MRMRVLYLNTVRVFEGFPVQRPLIMHAGMLIHSIANVGG